ncbi:hypothetical protein FIBSPDRAFT_878587, partial [Athelia psychrophila]
KAIIDSRFVEILLYNARKGTMWGLEVASRLLQSDFLQIHEFRMKLMDGGLMICAKQCWHPTSYFG